MSMISNMMWRNIDLRNKKAPLEGMSGAFGSSAEADDQGDAAKEEERPQFSWPALCGARPSPTNAELAGELCEK
jgi:hypothetical protein